MAISNVANAYETTLSSSMGPTALIANVASTSNAPDCTNPGAWLIIDPELPAKREYIFFDQATTSTTLSTSTIDNRYGEGSAAASGITHDEGATVWGGWLKQHLDEIVAELALKEVPAHDHDPTGSFGIDADYLNRDGGELHSYTERRVDAGTVASLAIDPTIPFQAIKCSSNTTTLTFGAWDGGGSGVQTFTIKLHYTTTTARPIFPATVLWPGGVVPGFNVGPVNDSYDLVAFQHWPDGNVFGFPIAINMQAP